MNTLKKEILQPKNKDELVKFIKDEINLHGNHCDLNHIDTSLITDMSRLFTSKKIGGFGFVNFNEDISKWNTSNVKNMSNMFAYSHFNGYISKWDTSNVNNMEFMFSYSQFNKDISQWDTSKVIDMSFMFSDSIFNQDISSWDILNLDYIAAMFYNSKISKIPQWDYFKIDNIKLCFDNCSELAEPLPDWYQFNDIAKAQKRQQTYEDYLKSNILNISISNNLNIKNKLINKI